MSDFKLYEIDSDIESLLNEIYAEAELNEGEINDEKLIALDLMIIERDIKILDIARYIKTLHAKALAFYDESMKLHKRYISVSNYEKRLKQFLTVALDEGEKLSDNNTLISWRKSESVNVIDAEKLPVEYLKIEKTPRLSLIKKSIKAGQNISGAVLIEKNNLQIK